MYNLGTRYYDPEIGRFINLDSVVAGVGGEFHVEWGTTVTLPKTQFNIYDLARSVYIKIMEW